MKDKIIKIPKIFQELHGEQTTLSNILFVYLTGLIAALLFLFQIITQHLDTWKIILFGIIIFDMSGGVVANLSSSTNQYYQKVDKQKRIFFLLLHFLHPLGLYLIFPEYFDYFVYLFLFTISSSLIVNGINKSEIQQSVASFFLVIGISCSMFFKLDFLILYLIAPIFMTKLILGFSVRRPSFNQV